MLEFKSVRFTAALGCATLMGMAAPASAAILQVPDQYDSVFAALLVAVSGDEIRVANTHTDGGSFLDTTGRDITIESYEPDFSAPAPGAGWSLDVAGGADNAVLTTGGGGELTLRGLHFTDIKNGNAIFLNSGATLNVSNCSFTGIDIANTAGIKTAANASDIDVTITDSTFDNNGRGIWFNQVVGNTSLDISDSSFRLNTSYPIEWRAKDGSNTFTMTDSAADIINNRQIRLLSFETNYTNPGLIENNAVIERCVFRSLEGTGRSPLKVAGVPDAADELSFMSIYVVNSVFDLIQGEDHVETVALDTQDDTAAREFVARFDHCTIAFGGTNQCGFRLRENKSLIQVSNSIIDGNGEGRAALRAWRGEIISDVNLLNATQNTEVATGLVTLSSNEILDVAPEFNDRLAGDLTLSQESPCLGVGEDLGHLVDVLGNARPNPAGSQPDLGAYEMADFSSVASWALY